MSFKISLFFIQKKINFLFCKFKAFYHIYIYKTIIFSAILKNYFYYIYIVFSCFHQLEIILKTAKVFMSFLSIILLE